MEVSFWSISLWAFRSSRPQPTQQRATEFGSDQGCAAGHTAGTAGAKYTFTIKEGADGKNGRISVNYDGFIDDVSVNDMLLVDGGMLSLKILEKTKQDVVCEVVDGGTMGSRSHCSALLCTALLPMSYMLLLHLHARCLPSCHAFPFCCMRW